MELCAKQIVPEVATDWSLFAKKFIERRDVFSGKNYRLKKDFLVKYINRILKEETRLVAKV